MTEWLNWKVPNIRVLIEIKYGWSWASPSGSYGKEPASNAGDASWIPGSGRSPGVGYGSPLQYSCLENPMDWGAWRATVHEVAKRVEHNWSNWACTYAWLIIYMGLLRWLSGKDSSFQCRRTDFNPQVRYIPWRRKWQPTPIFLPGNSHRQRSLEGYSAWGHKRVRHNLATKQQRTTYTWPYLAFWNDSVSL